ncbi:hypothetical protein ACFPTY_11360 [Halomonas beimenensis]|uniref:Uncharacterized protein n=1 Tax=Halomonas beimenensis TaxID=475662 RepID=A0A291P9S2_9GAMM|nr:hypothetical protein [Halomonas beimenensis]ATJ83611.1 hypothetical protein BEI_2624 [Halomonas beimenensis]
MRDLYQRLRLDPEADDAEIAAAIEACEHTALKADAAAVLQAEWRRAEYDALHDTLSDIGRLRARLGLTHAPYWRVGPADDFSLPPGPPGSRFEEWMQRLNHAARLHNRWRRLRGPWLLAALWLATLGGGVALGYYLL